MSNFEVGGVARFDFNSEITHAVVLNFSTCVGSFLIMYKGRHLLVLLYYVPFPPEMGKKLCTLEILIA